MLGYYLHSPLPGGISEPWKLKIIMAGFKLANLVARVGSSVGYDARNMSRATFGTAFAWASQPVSIDGLEITDTAVENIPIRVYRPRDLKQRDKLLPVIVYYHGGGMITFSIDTYENILRQVTKELQAVVVSVGYRLAPEHNVPAAIDDCYTVTVDVLKHASKYGGDETRVVIAGDSAGGALAASVSWRLAYNTSTHVGVSVLPKLQVLLYPMLQAFDFQTGSYITQSNEITLSGVLAGAWYTYCTGKSTTPVLELLANNHTSHMLKQSKYATFVDNSLVKDLRYKTNKPKPPIGGFNKELASEVENRVTHPAFAPLMAADLSQIPPTYILSAEFDVLRDECFMFETRLKSAGVSVMHEHLPGAWHGVVSYTRTLTGMNALRKVTDFLREHV